MKICLRLRDLLELIFELFTLAVAMMVRISRDIDLEHKTNIKKLS